MAVLPIVKLPDPVLRQEAREITEINGKLQGLIDDMAETMYAAPGLGLAANQVGELQRLIVFDVSHKEGRPRKLQVVLNPCIVAGEGEIIHEEGCLSVADFCRRGPASCQGAGQRPGPGRETHGNYRRGVAGRSAPA